MFEQVMTMVQALFQIGDVDIWEESDILFIEFQDFEGFDEQWNEISHPYAEPEMVDELLEILSDYEVQPRFSIIDGHEMARVWASDDI